jgi:cytochrome oxidase Cu insertion factor (SCO1/SenC/PrrC family)
VRALVVVAALGLLAVGCGGGTAADDPETPPATTAAPETSSRPPAPAIEGTTLDGDRMSLADLRGRPVFVNVWSSW